MRFVGVAVLASQFFEIVFVLVARFALKHPHAESADDVAPLPNGAFKQAVTALVKELRAAEHISLDLADRVIAFTEDRNLLVHRILFSKTDPNLSDADFFDALIHLSRRVYAEALSLCSNLFDTLLEYTARFPEAAESANQLRTKLVGFADWSGELHARVFD